jgi:holo-[acyl-carrier protein] synthase
MRPLRAMGARVGIDLVLVEQVADALQRHPERYLSRVYTEAEVSDCRAGDRVDATRLAARFAGKEATLKVLRPCDGGIPWADVEIRRTPGGWPEVILSGLAAERAGEEGLSDFSVSLTHEGGLAGAVVVANRSGGS